MIEQFMKTKLGMFAFLLQRWQEFASRHHESIACMSLDDKAKVPIEPPIVHRQCQINKLFLAGDSPNLPDHDICGSGSKCPNGYMILETKVGQTHDIEDSFDENSVYGETDDETDVTNHHIRDS